jgi:hypothetical protein
MFKHLSVVQREKKERNACDIELNLKHERSQRETVVREI